MPCGADAHASHRASDGAASARPKAVDGGSESTDGKPLDGRPGLSGGVRPGLRTPSGEDLSDPTVVRAKLVEELQQENPRWDKITDATAIEAFPLYALIAVILLVGIYPTILTRVFESGLQPILARLGG